MNPNYRQNRYLDRKAKGICSSCPAPAVEGKVRCQRCMDNNTKRLLKRRDEAIKNGKCSVCKKKPVKTYKICFKCRFRMNIDNQRRQLLNDRKQQATV